MMDTVVVLSSVLSYFRQNYCRNISNCFLSFSSLNEWMDEMGWDGLGWDGLFIYLSIYFIFFFFMRKVYNEAFSS